MIHVKAISKAWQPATAQGLVEYPLFLLNKCGAALAGEESIIGVFTGCLPLTIMSKKSADPG